MNTTKTSKKSKTNWSRIPLEVWDITFYKEDDNGNIKKYRLAENYDFSALCEIVEDDDLEEIGGAI